MWVSGHDLNQNNIHGHVMDGWLNGRVDVGGTYKLEFEL